MSDLFEDRLPRQALTVDLLVDLLVDFLDDFLDDELTLDQVCFQEFCELGKVWLNDRTTAGSEYG